MDPDLFITIVFGSLVAVFTAGGAVVALRERRRSEPAEPEVERQRSSPTTPAPAAAAGRPTGSRRGR